MNAPTQPAPLSDKESPLGISSSASQSGIFPQITQADSGGSFPLTPSPLDSFLPWLHCCRFWYAFLCVKDQDGVFEKPILPASSRVGGTDGTFNTYSQDDEWWVEGRIEGQKQEGGMKEDSIASGEQLEVHSGRR